MVNLNTVRLNEVTLSFGKTSNVTQRGIVGNSNSEGLSGSTVGVTTLNSYNIVDVTDDIFSGTSDVTIVVGQTRGQSSYSSDTILSDNLDVYRVVLVNGVVLNVQSSGCIQVVGVGRNLSVGDFCRVRRSRSTGVSTTVVRSIYQTEAVGSSTKT